MPPADKGCPRLDSHSGRGRCTGEALGDRATPYQRRPSRAPSRLSGATNAPLFTAWEAAGEAAEAVRALNPLPLPPGGYGEPADVDAVLTELSMLAGRLPQALAQ